MDDQEQRDEILMELVTWIVAILIVALFLLLAGCAGTREWLETPITSEPGAVTQGGALVGGLASGLTVANPMLGFGVLALGRGLLRALRRK